MTCVLWVKGFFFQGGVMITVLWISFLCCSFRLPGPLPSKYFNDFPCSFYVSKRKSINPIFNVLYVYCTVKWHFPWCIVTTILCWTTHWFLCIQLSSLSGYAHAICDSPWARKLVIILFICKNLRILIGSNIPFASKY